MKYSSGVIARMLGSYRSVSRKIEDDFARGVALYGAGVVGSWALDYLQSIGAVIRCVVDRDPAKHGKRIKNIPIVSPDYFRKSGISSMFIAARHSVSEVIEGFGAENFDLISFDGYFVVRNFERLCSVRDNYLEDERSVEVFNAVLLAMLSGSAESCRCMTEKNMYFTLPEFSGTFEEIFVDAGAFVGDSTEAFIWENLGTFRHIYAFEPGVKQFKAMQKRVNRLMEEWAFDEGRISLVNAGLSSKNEKMICTFIDDFPIRHGLAGGEESSNKSELFAEVHSLDSYLNRREATFLKVDIEGMEMEFLKGARETIQQCRPKIAICVYHYPSDLYEVAEYLRELVPEYKFKLRQHAPILGDFVLYCYV